MRLDSKSDNPFIEILNTKNQQIQDLFLENIQKQTKTVPIKVMLGDSTITEQTTFDPMHVNNFYQQVVKNLRDWTVQDVSTTNNDDLRRIFTKFEIKEGNYILSGHMSIQFHVLLSYKSDYRVIKCQKELSEIIDKTKNKENQMAEDADHFILNKLKELGYKDLDHKDLFEIFFENDELQDKIYKEIEAKSDISFQKLSKRKTELFNELDSLLIETYQTTPILIDENKLVTGEEGCLCTFDLEFIKDKNKIGLFNPKKIPERIKKNIILRLDQFSEIMKI